MIRNLLSRLKLSLRALLMAVVLVAIPSAYLGRPVMTYQRENRVVSRLEELGANCSRKVRYSKMTPALRAAIWWGQTRFFERVDHVDLSKCPSDVVDDDVVKLLTNLQDLRGVNLFGAGVTDNSVEVLSTLPRIRSLILSATKITDKCGPYLADMHELQHLDLSSTSVTDEVLDQIQQLKDLRSLKTQNTQITISSIADRFPREITHQSVRERYREMGNCGSGGDFPNHHVFWLNSAEKVSVMVDALEAIAEDPGYAFSIAITEQLGTDELVKKLAASPSVVAILVDSNKLTSEGVHELTSAHQLRFLGIYGTHLSTACLSGLLEMPKMTRIMLPDTMADDAPADGAIWKIQFTDDQAPNRSDFTKQIFHDAHHLWATPESPRSRLKAEIGRTTTSLLKMNIAGSETERGTRAARPAKNSVAPEPQ